MAGFRTGRSSIDNTIDLVTSVQHGKSLKRPSHKIAQICSMENRSNARKICESPLRQVRKRCEIYLVDINASNVKKRGRSRYLSLGVALTCTLQNREAASPLRSCVFRDGLRRERGNLIGMRRWLRIRFQDAISSFTAAAHRNGSHSITAGEISQ